MSARYDVLIIGAGAAGLMAAVQLQNRGLRVGLLERNARIGKKLLATGNGRCNYTNIYAGVGDYYGTDPAFAGPALEAFSAADAVDFFRRMGIEPRIEAGGKVFPASEQAGSFLDLFLLALEEGDAEVMTQTQVTGIRRVSGGFLLETGEQTFRAGRVLLAPGGKAMPSSGSDGNAYALAVSLSHTITPLSPSLVQLMLEGDFFPRIDGVKLRRALRLGSGEDVLQTEEGDLLFAGYGISGPPALQLSRPAARLLEEGKKPWVSVVLFECGAREMYARLCERFAHFPQRPLPLALIGLVHKRLIPVLLGVSGLTDKTLPCGKLSRRQLTLLSTLLVDWRIPVRGTKSWPSAQVTAGGVSTGEVSPRTMESRITPGLYFAGEVLDIDGRSGGFNLQWAWSSAAAAARAILEAAC